MFKKKQGKYQFSDFEVDLEQRSLRRQGHPVIVSTRTFDLLTFFVLNPERLITKDELIAALWPHSEVEESNLSQHIFLLRKALTSKEPGERVIASVPNFGYEFTVPVSTAPTHTSPRPAQKLAPKREGDGRPAPRRFQHDEDPPGRRQYPPTSSSQFPPQVKDSSQGPIEKPLLSEADNSGEIARHVGEIAKSVSDEPSCSNPGTEPMLSGEGLAFAKTSISTEPKPRVASSRGKNSRNSNPNRTNGFSRFLRSFAHPGPIQVVWILALIALLGGSGWLGWRMGHRIHPDSVSIVVADFQNATGNPDFDQALRTALAIDLRQSPYLEVSTRDKINQMLSQMKLPAQSVSKPDTPKDGDDAEIQPPPLVGNLARDVCRQLKDNAYLTGEIQPFVLKYLISVEAINCITGSRIAVSKGLANSPDGVLAVLDKIAADLRKQLGEPAQSVAGFEKPLFADGNHSFEALKSYSAASHLALEGKLHDSLPLFQRAIELDPKFTMAFADLGAVYSNLGDKDQAILNFKKAYGLRDSADEPNKLFITAAFHNIVTHDLHAAIRNADQWSQEYPRDPAPLIMLAELQTQIGKPALAVDPARKSLVLSPNDPSAYAALARAQVHLGQFEDAAKTCQEAIHRNLDNVQIHTFLLQIAFLNLDQPAIDEQIAWGHAQMPEDAADSSESNSDETSAPRPVSSALDLPIARMDLAQGKVKKAEAIFTRLIAEDRRQGKIDQANELQQELPRIEAELGYPVTALAALKKLKEGEPTNDTQGQQSSENSWSTDIPVAWAEVGETSRAEAILQSMLQARPSDTLLDEYQGPQIRAAIDLSQHHPESAIEALDLAHSYDLRSFDAPALRAQAYLAAKQYQEAEAEFHKILDHSGVEPFSYNYPLAQLGVARALAQQGKLVEASYAYKVVLQIWKDADPDMPRLKQAKAEYAKLNGAPIKMASNATASSPVSSTNGSLGAGASAISRNAVSKPKSTTSAAKKSSMAPDGVPIKSA